MESVVLRNSEIFIPRPDARASLALHITTLPPEILAEIFLDFLPRYPGFPPCTGRLSPLLLCRICREWRMVALSTPTLWRAISVDFFVNDTDGLVIQKLELLENWVSRSGNCPLSVSIRISCPMDPLLLDRLLHAVMSHCERWQHVTLHIPSSCMHLLQGEMPRLRDLNFGPTNYSRTYDGPLTLFDRAPQLRTLVLTKNFLTSNLRLPWTQITHLESACLYEHECLEILSEAAHFIRFSVIVYPDLSNFSVVEAIPVRPHFCDLALLVDDDEEDWDCKILDRLTLPALRTLQVSELSITLESLKAFMSRSQCTLLELRITHATLPESAFRDVLPTFGAIILENAVDANE
ncbi:hypothetical protein C8F04DRAFT_1075311 [Mycena alexandri]|uniref:F-box domain-containing protein n=1 Tax=Mycena alexandri TaxID=1745969 RepID=A0AAD6TC13_9AGAR|nr:hypothetical protein C8F04DRAFT_1075311 [Mycena alexandri]